MKTRIQILNFSKTIGGGGSGGGAPNPIFRRQREDNVSGGGTE